jgi:peptidoglycan/LPS O-acetylase OafA/YrhL
LVIGPFLSIVPIDAYYASPQIWQFISLNISAGLPGVFEHNPLPNAINGSLWTLMLEIKCYFGVLALGVAGALNRWIVALIYISLLALSLLWLGGDLPVFASMFAGGAMMYLWRPHLTVGAAAACVAVLIAGTAFGGLRLTYATAGAYLVIYVALALGPLLAVRARRSDLSYGIYIWAFPVQQTVSQVMGPSVTWWANLLISAPVVAALAWLSWRGIESPALAWRRSLRAQRVRAKPA